MFGKFFKSAYSGSMYGAGFHVFAVWGYAIASADRKGFVELNPRALGPTLGGNIQEVESAIEYLMRPDPDSRSEEADGRRLVREGMYLYRIVNYTKYRNIRDADARREQTRQAVRRYREKHVSNVSHGKPEKATVITCKQRKAHAEAEAEGEVEEEDSAEPLSRSTPKFIFQVVGNGKTWEPADPFIAKLRETFPNLDVLGELKVAALWTETHASKRKTARGMPAFLARWMERAVNSPRPNVNVPQNPVKKQLTPEQAEKSRLAQETSQRQLDEDLRLQREEIARRKAEESAEATQALLPGVAA